MLKKFRKPKLQFKRKRTNKQRWLLLATVIVVILAGIWLMRDLYFNNLRPVSSNSTTVYFTVSSGETKHQIAQNLQHAKLIRSSSAFETYLRSKEIQILEAGTYKFSQSMTVQQIVHEMVVGDVAKNLLTILPGKTIRQIRAAFKEAGYTDKEIDVAFDSDTYAGDPALAYLPPGASLEGLLYPDSFQKEADTPATTIVKESLDEMRTHLTQSIVNGFVAHGLNTYQGLTLASIVYQESGDSNYQPTVAQVFLSRLKQGMMLGSDVTAFYAAGLVNAGMTLGVDSPYNTRLHTGLPPGPIGNFTDSALKAVAAPSHTDYLYFVAGDDGTIHFSHTRAQHEQAIRRYCSKACSQ